eukprot:66930-Chlamydomonas_euryale.AAC.1
MHLQRIQVAAAIVAYMLVEAEVHMRIASRNAVAALRAVSRPRWRGVVGMGWLKTVRSDVPFVTALSPCFDPSRDRPVLRCSTQA